ncbi:MAG: MazG nucleotide pyrophosphohydrolase domain-containing protein [Candidatus Woesearchaeota archaeon]
MDCVDEFGDALFQLMHLANQMDVDLEEAMEKVLKKYSEYVKDK